MRIYEAAALGVDVYYDIPDIPPVFSVISLNLPFPLWTAFRRVRYNRGYMGNISMSWQPQHPGSFWWCSMSFANLFSNKNTVSSGFMQQYLIPWHKNEKYGYIISPIRNKNLWAKTKTYMISDIVHGLVVSFRHILVRTLQVDLYK